MEAKNGYYDLMGTVDGSSTFAFRNSLFIRHFGSNWVYLVALAILFVREVVEKLFVKAAALDLFGK